MSFALAGYGQKNCGLTFMQCFHPPKPTPNPQPPTPPPPLLASPGTRQRGCRVAGGEIKQRARRLRATGEAALRRRLGPRWGDARRADREHRPGRTEHFVPRDQWSRAGGDSVAVSRAIDGATATVE